MGGFKGLSSEEYQEECSYTIPREHIFIWNFCGYKSSSYTFQRFFLIIKYFTCSKASSLTAVGSFAFYAC